jgi:hypothetical protein
MHREQMNGTQATCSPRTVLEGGSCTLTRHVEAHAIKNPASASIKSIGESFTVLLSTRKATKLKPRKESLPFDPEQNS